MASLVLNGNTSGSVTISSPAVSGTTTLTLPTTSGTVITTGSTFGGTGPAFRAYRSTSLQSIPINTNTKIQLNAEDFDTNNNFDSTTNYRFTPTVAGYYFISGCVALNNNVNNVGAYVLIYKNGTSIASSSGTANANVYSGLTVSTLVYCNGSTDYIELYAFQNQGTYSALSGIFVNGDATYLSGFLARSA